MNILPKKSWHVRNKDNVERVRRDEENARLEEEKKAKRAALAEQEARTELLRAQSRSGQQGQSAVDGTSQESAIVPVPDKPKHLNFFQEIEEGLQQGTNPEYEAEKKAEQEKQEKAIGLLTYLGQSASEQHTEKPWYLKKNGPRDSHTHDEGNNSRDCKRKDALDPLKTMTKCLEAKKKTDSHHRDKKHNKAKYNKDKKEKHGDKKSKTSSKKKSIEELRAERLKREKEERSRERELLSSSRGEEKKSQELIEENPYRYNSQFNPDLVRKPRQHHRSHPY